MDEHLTPSTEQSVQELVSALRRATAIPKKYVQAREFRVPRQDGNGEYLLVNWKTSEIGFRAATLGSQELPTLARGLFIQDLGDDRGRIAVRGYDKFFSEGEMKWTKPESIAAHSTAPYLLTFKENGCIIFISSLSPTQLVVTSKNSLGAREDALAHAIVGQDWLRRHLAAAGRTEAELAAELWARNETAVAELCDDSFEEHVLGYPPERSGLHLHGLNSNTPAFKTRDMRDVDAFAAAWGFLPTRWMEFKTLEEMRLFTAGVATTGAWQGEAIEGFVVRTHMPSSSGEGEPSSLAERPPYSPGQAWFYKVKFDEPYLMYRHWREKMVGMLNQRRAWDEKRTEGIEKARNDEKNKAEGLAEKAKKQKEREVAASSSAIDATTAVEAGSAGTPETTSKKQLNKQAAAQRKAAAKDDKKRNPPRPDRPTTNSKRAESHLFISWCYDRIWGHAQAGVERDEALFDGVLDGHGIIRVRNEFLRYLETPEALSELVKLRLKLKETSSADVRRSDTRPFRTSGPGRALVVPIAVPGCGKTALCVALRTLYPAPVTTHEQSDNITSKRTAFAFLQNIFDGLASHEVVLADRNNHLRAHRKEIVQRVAATEHPDASKKQAADKYKEVRANAKKKKQGAEKGQAEETRAAAPSDEAPRIRLIALAWRISPPLQHTFDVCKQRLISRGDRHQVLRCEDGGSTAEVERILWRMLSEHEAFDSSATAGDEDADHGFDDVVWVDADVDLETNVRSVSGRLAQLLALPAPSDEALAAALAAARSYVPKVHKDLTINPPPATRYYAIALRDLDLGGTAVERACAHHAQAAAFLERLKRDGRLTSRPHITLVHATGLEEAVSDSTPSAEAAEQHKGAGSLDAPRARWLLYARLCAASSAPSFRVRLDRLAWDKRAMVLGVSLLELVEGGDSSDDESTAHLRCLVKDCKARGSYLHVTVGTAGPEIPGFEAHRVLAAADERPEDGQEGSGDIKMVRLDGEIEATGRLEGMY